MARDAYTDAGVDVAAAEHALDSFRRSWPMKSIDAYSSLGEFGHVVQVGESMRRPLMVTSADGVGTKTEIARRLGRLDTIGQDLVAMCADDVVCHGARPTYFMDYVAVGHVDERVNALIGGVAQACDKIGCALIGGETAEHPGLMADDAFDLAGFCIGFVESDALIDATASRAGDVIVGLASSGLHSNGFSLVRKLVDEGKLPLTDELLKPTALYAPAVLTVADQLRANDVRFGGFAHITGGGLARNLPRALDRDLAAVVDPSTWPEPRVFEQIALAAGMLGTELRAIFNCGIGFAIVAEPDAAQLIIDTLADNEIDAWVIGDVQRADDHGGERYVEA